MPTIIRSALAEEDLMSIWRYIAEDSPAHADAFLDGLESKFHLLASSPEMGKEYLEFAPRLRGFPVKRYTIFYRIIEGGIEVARVLHGARDIPSLFRETLH